MTRPRPARATLLAAVVLASVAARAAPRLPAVADEALTSAENLLGKTTGDERVIACVDALPFLEIVIKHAPDYAYAIHLHGECLYLTDQWEPASRALQKYL